MRSIHCLFILRKRSCKVVAYTNLHYYKKKHCHAFLEPQMEDFETYIMSELLAKNRYWINHKKDSSLPCNHIGKWISYIICNYTSPKSVAASEKKLFSIILPTSYMKWESQSLNPFFDLATAPSLFSPSSERLLWRKSSFFNDRLCSIISISESILSSLISVFALRFNNSRLLLLCIRVLANNFTP